MLDDRNSSHSPLVPHLNLEEEEEEGEAVGGANNKKRKEVAKATTTVEYANELYLPRIIDALAELGPNKLTNKIIENALKEYMPDRDFSGTRLTRLRERAKKYLNGDEKTIQVARS